MKTHELKTDPEVFEAVWKGLKLFEIRFNDRSFKVGDTLHLRETKYSAADMKHGHVLIYTGREMYRIVRYAIYGPIYGLMDGWVILAFDAPPQ